MKTEYTKRYRVLWQVSGVSTVTAMNRKAARKQIEEGLAIKSPCLVPRDIIGGDNLCVRGIKDIKEGR